MNPALTEAMSPVGRTWTAPGRRINHTVAGSGEAGTVLLIAGLGMQRIEWQPRFVSGLLDRGLRVVMADNRDCGRSHVAGGEYGLADMAGDLLLLLDHLGIERVHVVGISMGGMLAQHVALRAPERCLSLTSLMSSTGRRGSGRPHEGAKWIFTAEVPCDSVDAYADYAERHHVSIAGATHVELEFARETAVRSYIRGLRPQGTARQLAAIKADGDRTERLATITVPTLVVHGDDDPMIDVSGGRDTADAIPGADLLLLRGVGHTIPAALADGLAERLAAHFARSVG